MYKTNEEIIVIQAKTTTPISTGVVFWSHDKGTAKMLFQLQKDYVNQTLAEGTIVPICLDFVGGRHIYHAVIEDAVNGIVSIVLEDNILGYVGRVTGSIYIELPDSRSLDTAGRFTFDIKRSPIDLNTPELEDYYWQGFNEIMNQYHQTITEIETESERLLNELQARILTLEEKLDNVELRARFKTAWSWSADGTDRFTKVYPGENLYVGADNIRLNWYRPHSDDTDTIYSTATEDGWQYFDIATIKPTQHSEILAKPAKYLDLRAGVTYTQSFLAKTDCDVMENGAQLNWFSPTGSNYQMMYSKKLGADLYVIYSSYTAPTDFSLRLFDFSSIFFNVVETGTYLYFKGFKIEEGENTNPIYTPAPSEDPINAYPQYKGISIVDSDNPADYSWQAEDNTIAKKTDLTKGKVGLGNVDNYSTATQAEAEAGTVANKFMTPLRTAQQIEKKAVTIASNQTIGGIKNLLQTPLVNDVPVATYKDLGEKVTRGSGLTTIQSDKQSSFTDFAYEFRRTGNTVHFYARVNVKDATSISTSFANMITPPAGFSFAAATQTSLSGIPLNVRQWTMPQGAYGGVLILDGSSVVIKFASNKTGNHYISGSWPTDDKWPS